MMELNLFNYRTTTESSYYEPSSDRWIAPTTEGLEQAYLEAAEDFATLEAASYVMDSKLAHVAVMESYGSYQMLKENAITSFFATMKEKVKALWEKVKAWFKRLWENVKIFFMSGDKFIKQYEAKLKSKKKTDFTYKTYEFDLEKAAKAAAKIIKKCGTMKTEANTLIENAGKGQIDKQYTEDHVEKLENDFLKEFNLEDASDIKKHIREEAGIEDGVIEIDEFKQGLSLDKMINLLKEGKKMTNEVEKDGRDADKSFRTLISSIDKLASKFEKAENGTDEATVAAGVRKAVSYATSVNGWSNAATDALVGCYKLAYNESLRVLKRFAYFKEVEKNSSNFGGMFDNFSI